MEFKVATEESVEAAFKELIQEGYSGITFGGFAGPEGNRLVNFSDKGGFFHQPSLKSMDTIYILTGFSVKKQI